MKTDLNRRTFLLGLAGAGALGRYRGLDAAIERKITVSLKEAHQGTLEVDTHLMDSYGGPEEPLRSFYLKARSILSNHPNGDFTDPAIVRAAQQQNLALMGGPMLGDLAADGVTVWLRPATTGPLTVEVTPDGNGPTQTCPVGAARSGEVLRIRLDGLSAQRTYHYQILDRGRPIASGSFATAPPQENRGLFRAVFGSCCHKIGLHNPNLFRAILERKPDVLWLLGDIAVDDRENRIAMHRADYQLRDISKPWRELAAQIPIYAAWDDHDYFNNDLSGIPQKFTAADRDAVRAVWRQNWVNPPAHDNRRGIYFNTRLGPVELIMLDTRSCRDNARRHEYGSYLGKRQLDWLKQTLRQSTAPFKVVSSGTMWSDYVTRAKDSWGSWDTQAREELFGLIEQERIAGVLLISGDRHGARGFQIPRPSGYRFHEFEVASLGGCPGPAGRVKNCPEQLFGYDGDGFVAFGEFTFDTTITAPCVTFRLIDQWGTVREKQTLSYEQLTPPKQLHSSD